MKHSVKVLPYNKIIEVANGSNLLSVLRNAGYAPDAPCGGHGTCGKCIVTVNGKEQLACQTVVYADMSVAIPDAFVENIISDKYIQNVRKSDGEDFFLVFDIGTTTIVCYLLNGKDGTEISCASMLNPQVVYGADVISRIQAGVDGNAEHMKQLVQDGLCRLIQEVCENTGIETKQIKRISVVANPAMQQLFMGIDLDNLVSIPYTSAITATEIVPAKDYVPSCMNAELLVVPDISAYVGADALACVLVTKMYETAKNILMVDIGTNGEMVLGNSERMLACSTAAGPAFEGAKIKFGMRGAIGAIDHVWLKDGEIRCHVIGEGRAKGICGSGLIDAVAVALDAGLINARGRIQDAQEMDGQRVIRLCDEIYLTQADIREVQLAKSAIASGIEIMISRFGIDISEVDEVLLAGAFGSFMNPISACKIGILPQSLQDKIDIIGNAAGEGAKLLVNCAEIFQYAQYLAEQIECVELAKDNNFPRAFAKNMLFK